MFPHTLAVLLILASSVAFAQTSADDLKAEKDAQKALDTIRGRRAQYEKEKAARNLAGMEGKCHESATQDGTLDCVFTYIEQPGDQDILHGPITQYVWLVGEHGGFNGNPITVKGLEERVNVGVSLIIMDKTGRWQQSHHGTAVPALKFKWAEAITQ